MAQENIQLNKKIYGARGASEAIDRSFSELTKSKDPVNVDKLFQMYNDLFYDIPKEGEKSHTQFIIQSTDFVNDFEDPRDAQIDDLLERIIDLEEELVDANTTQEHPFFQDGSFLRTPNTSIYYMQQGKARRVVGMTIYTTMVTAKGLRVEDEPFTEVQASTINEIGQGKPIRNESDLSDFTEIVPQRVTRFLELSQGLQNINITDGQLAQLKAIIDNKTASDPSTIASRSPISDGGGNNRG